MKAINVKDSSLLAYNNALLFISLNVLVNSYLWNFVISNYE